MHHTCIAENSATCFARKNQKQEKEKKKKLVNSRGTCASHSLHEHKPQSGDLLFPHAGLPQVPDAPQTESDGCD